MTFLVLPGGAHTAHAATVPVINTIAGGFGGPDPGTNVSLNAVGSTVAAVGGSVYFDAHSGFSVRVLHHWRLNEVTDELATTPVTPPKAADASGNLLIATPTTVQVLAEHTGVYYGQHMTAGNIYTVAGNGTPGFSGDGGSALRAKLDFPGQVTTDHAGNLVIADSGNGRIRVVAVHNGTYYDQAMKAGDIYTVFAQGTSMWGVAVDPYGNLVAANPVQVYVLAEKTGTFYGRQMTAGSFYLITSIFIKSMALDGSGNIVLLAPQSVQVVAAQSGTFYGQNMVAGQVYTIDKAYASGMSIDQEGNIVLPSRAYYRIDLLAVKSGMFYGQQMTAGSTYTIAGNGRWAYSGDGGPALSAEMTPAEVGEDLSGNLLVTDPINFVVRVIAAKTGVFYGQPMTAGDIYTIAGTGSQGNTEPDGVPALQADLLGPLSVTTDAAGNVLLTDVSASNDGTPQQGTGGLVVLAEHTGTYYGRQMIAGDIYSIPGADAYSVHRDPSGNLLLCVYDKQEVDVYAVVSGTFYGIEMTAGHIYKVAGGGPGTALNGYPALQSDAACTDVMSDPSGNLAITNPFVNRITMVAAKPGTFYGVSMKAGYLYTIAGNGKSEYGRDGIPARAASLRDPLALAFDAAGNLLIADTLDYQIRVVAVRTASFYAQAMKADYIYVLAGTGTDAFSGDGGPARQASLVLPAAVRVVPGRGIVITDSNMRLRLISG